MSNEISIVGLDGQPLRAKAGFTSAGTGFGGQMADWYPQLQSADAALLPVIDTANARADDLARNNAIASGAVQIHIDNIVGSHFRLSYKPRNKRLGINREDLAAFRADVETLWMEEAEDETGCWLDAERKRTFTMQVREIVGTHTVFNEACAIAMWDKSARRPCRTAIRMISPKRVSNPNNMRDSDKVRGGVRIGPNSEALAYFVRSVDSASLYGTGYGYRWDEVRRETRFGRPQFLHIFEPTEDGQTRAANQFMRVMEQLHMLPKLQHTKLQNAIVNAMYAATIETELGSEVAMEILGADNLDNLQKYMLQMAQFHKGKGISLNGGAKATHLLPNERLQLHTSGNVDNGYTSLEDSCLRWIARGFNVPHEALSQNYTRLSYSTARASMLEARRYFLGRRKVIASRFASTAFALWLEEKIDRGHLVLPRSASGLGFYDAKSAWCNAEWIGSGRLAIDGLKEVKESILRIEAGLSTYEKELAQMGEDYQEIFEQQVIEMAEREKAGLPPPSWMQAEQFAPDEVSEPAPPPMSDR